MRRLAWLMALGCSGSHTARPFDVEVRDAQGQPAANFRVIVARASGVSALSCPSSPPAAFGRCTPRGFELAQPEPGSELRVLSRGHAFQDLELAEPFDRPLVVELQALPPFEATANYRTGFDAATGEADFTSLAVRTATELGPAWLVKFLITLGSEPRVYFQDTPRFPRHSDFARDALGIPGSSASFAEDTYRGAERRALAGTLAYLPNTKFSSRALGAVATAPLTLEFFPSDDLSPEQARLAYRLLAERMSWLALDGVDRRLFYLPAGSTQEAELELDRAAFERKELLFSDHVELQADIDRQFLNPGISFGTLRALAPEELPTALVSFRDLLLLPRLPNDAPLSGGTITEELQTPLSHVNLAAQARGTPNLALQKAALDPRVAPFLGKLVRLEVTTGDFDVREAPLEQALAFWAARAPEAFVPRSDTAFRGLPRFEELHFADSLRVGSKAANLAELRQLLGEQAPGGFAIPFSAYDDYMRENGTSDALCSQARAACAEAGRAAAPCQGAEQLCQASAAQSESYYAFIERLLADPETATDTALREAGLSTLSLLVREGSLAPDLAGQLDSRVAELFGTAQVRLRSSTNAEDLPGFSGAGLYVSVSARAAGAERASLRIRDVWASAWSFRAFEERAFWNIDQGQVRVAVAVNAAIDSELANGVLITRDLARPGAAGLYVNVQRGEVEVANPESGALPEVFSIVEAPGGGVQVVRQRYSSLSPAQPLLTDAETAQLAELADQVQHRFTELYAMPENVLTLDIEFKLLAEGRRLQIKQARPYSVPSP